MWQGNYIVNFVIQKRSLIVLAEQQRAACLSTRELVIMRYSMNNRDALMSCVAVNTCCDH